MIFKSSLELALSIILKERGLYESILFCCFPHIDKRFLTTETDLSMKFKQDIRLHHEISSPMFTPIRNCGSFFVMILIGNDPLQKFGK